MPSRAQVATITVAVGSLLSIGRLFVQIADFYPTAPSPDGVTGFDSRFTALGAMLPRKGIIGYVTDPGVPLDETDAQAEYHLTQYALAPVLVDRSPEHRFVIGNFHQKVSVGSLRERGFNLVREFGNGIALLENEKVR